MPPNLELTIITASVVGGVSILGGIGSVVGSTLAAILLAAIAQLADLPQRLALLDPRRAGRADPGHRAGRPVAPPPAGGPLMARRRTATRAARPPPSGSARRPCWPPSWPLALLVLAFTSEQFFTVDNLLNQGRLACEVGLVALPMT